MIFCKPNPAIDLDFILAIKDSPSAIAAATVLSNLLSINRQLIEPQSIQKSLRLPKQSVLIITESQLNYLATLRLHGFAGAVLLLSSNTFTSVKKKHRLLRSGAGSHDGCDFPWKLADLLAKISELVPLEPENLEMLQKELKAPEKWLQRQVKPRLKRLQQSQENFLDELDEIAIIIGQVREETPAACHVIVEIEGYSAQIQQHFQQTVEQMRQAQKPEKATIARLQQIFEQWQKIVLGSEEGLGASIWY